MLVTLPATVQAANLELLAPQALASTVTIAAAGDISRPSLGGPPQQTADLVTSLGTTAVFALGDTQYPHGSLSDFQNFYDASWGAFKNKTYPIPGNHEYETSGASGYFQYFGTGSAVPIASPGYYSLNLGDWHIAFLNTELHADRLYGGEDLACERSQRRHAPM